MVAIPPPDSIRPRGAAHQLEGESRPLLVDGGGEGSVDRGSMSTKDDQIRLSIRVVTHLDRVGVPGADGVGRPEATQQGIAQSLSVTQGAVSKVLRRLVAAEVVRVERHHVRGLNRRVRIYFLSRTGEALARKIHGQFVSTRPGSAVGAQPPAAGKDGPRPLAATGPTRSRWIDGESALENATPDSSLDWSASIPTTQAPLDPPAHSSRRISKFSVAVVVAAVVLSAWGSGLIWVEWEQERASEQQAA